MRGPLPPLRPRPQHPDQNWPLSRRASRGLTIELDEKAMAYLAQKGYDPSFGARPRKTFGRPSE
ncbi:hypothetical protein [Yoonia sp.]|uniref:hypothetical protein n=1 Tax=Yoonia sp. TaxID=2212373 RepID=UPI003976EDAC